MGAPVRCNFEPIRDPSGLIDGTPANIAKRREFEQRERRATVERLEHVRQSVIPGQYSDEFYLTVAKDFDSLGPDQLKLAWGLGALVAISTKLDEYYGKFTDDVLRIMTPRQRAALDRDLGAAIVESWHRQEPDEIEEDRHG